MKPSICLLAAAYIYGIIAYLRIYRRRKLRLNWPVLLAWPVVWAISMWRGGNHA